MSLTRPLLSRLNSGVVIFALTYLVQARVFADVTYTLHIMPGTPAEAAILLKDFGSAVSGESRGVSTRGGWVYRIIVPPNSRCELRFRGIGSPLVDVMSFDLKPVPSKTETGASETIVLCTSPASQPMGAALRFQFHSATPFSIHDILLLIRLADTNGNGISDAVETMMGGAPGRGSTTTPVPDRPHTSFQTGQPYSPGIGVPSDAVLVYNSDPKVVKSWVETGRTIQTMGGFREGQEYVQAHPGEVQKDGVGTPISIGGNSFYMVPTIARNQKSIEYYRAALIAGSSAVCPEEPELWTAAGYSESFKQEWQSRYGTPWQGPDSSIEARYKSEQLKGFLTTRQIGAVLDSAREIKPGATRMVAIHSPVTYYQWNIAMPHYSLLRLPSLQEIIGQVWTGTARTAARNAGVRGERTFEVGYLEYSSLFHLARGSGKRMWFLMDPVEDNPNLPMEDYHRNYEQTLAAALMFPDIDSYELMPWPQRIYGRVPEKYATEINTVVGALSDMWRFPKSEVDTGSKGIGTFFSDSMAWQRGEPYPSDYDGFYGLCLPLVSHGVPVDVLSLDRVPEPGYLASSRVLLLSYDFLKPAGPEINRSLAEWVRDGGSLILFGGTDAYNSLRDSWWSKLNVASPLDGLFTQLSMQTRIARVIETSKPAQDSHAQYKTILESGGQSTGGRWHTLDLTTFASTTGSVCVRFEDSTPSDGNGPMVYSTELRVGGKLAAAFRSGSELETRFLEEERGSKYNGEGRFADKTGYWIYRFDNLPQGQPIALSVDIAHGYRVKACPASEADPVLQGKPQTPASLASLRLRGGYPITLYSPPVGATALYRLKNEETPAVWEAKVGKGNVLFAGVSPAYLSASAQSSRWLRWLVERAFEKQGAKYRETGLFQVKRGPYLIARAMSKEQRLDGKFVDLLDSNLQVVEDPIVPAGGCRFLQEVGTLRGIPHLLAVSGRVRARNESAGITAFFAQSPEGTGGAARVWAGKRTARGVKAFTLLGVPLSATFEQDGDTVLVRYPNRAEGIVVRVGWS